MLIYSIHGIYYIIVNRCVLVYYRPDVLRLLNAHHYSDVQI